MSPSLITSGVWLGLTVGRRPWHQLARAQEGEDRDKGARQLPSPELPPALCPPDSSYFMYYYPVSPRSPVPPRLG